MYPIQAHQLQDVNNKRKYDGVRGYVGTLYVILDSSVKLKLQKNKVKFSAFHCGKAAAKEKHTMRFQKNGHLKCWQGYYAAKIFTLLVRMSNGKTTLENSLAISYDPPITLLGIYSRKISACVYTNTCTQMCIAALSLLPRDKR